MKSSGKLGIIRNKSLRNDIVKLYGSLVGTENYILEANTFGRELAVDLGVRKGLSRYMPQLGETFIKYNSPNELYKLHKDNAAVMNHITNQNWTIYEFRPMAKSQLKQIEKVISAIKDYEK